LAPGTEPNIKLETGLSLKFIYWINNLVCPQAQPKAIPKSKFAQSISSLLGSVLG